MKLPWSQDNYIKAYCFAAQAHRGQLVPGTKLPYMMHLSLVSMEIMSALASGEKLNGDFAIQCALLHDVLEDTSVRYKVLAAAFGARVARGVLALTKDSKLPKAQQMADCLRRIHKEPREVWAVKLADRITNLQRPPNHWSKAKIEAYLLEAMEIYNVLHESSPFLAARLILKIEQYAAYFAVRRAR